MQDPDTDDLLRCGGWLVERGGNLTKLVLSKPEDEKGLSRRAPAVGAGA